MAKDGLKFRKAARRTGASKVGLKVGTNRGPKPVRSASEIPEEQLELPAGYSADGSRMVSLREVLSPDVPTADFPQLAPEQKAALTAERIRRQPKFKLGMVGAGIIDKERAIQEVKAQSDVGRTLIEIEQRTINHLIKKATGKR
jgi:hypothetical protein